MSGHRPERWVARYSPGVPGEDNFFLGPECDETGDMAHSFLEGFFVDGTEGECREITQRIGAAPELVEVAQMAVNLAEEVGAVETAEYFRAALIKAGVLEPNA